ncbi:hypothetical protein WJX72_005475 [[Myrmecia] bisecta]|uniref:Survival protein SurE-like phosphatase/nucleotidase domain-containing protein n=1 Tax=[Myrmecia] bisecta TaxID=41462 RepID=A0AAW1NYN6_9CHLO
MSQQLQTLQSQTEQHSPSLRHRSQVQCNASREASHSPRPARVLLTNDDGPHSPFFQAWVPYVKNVLGWDCFVCLPADAQSFVSKSIGKGPIQVTDVDAGTVHIGGPPATCVNIGLYHLAPECDFVVAGPNVGHNVGRGSVLSSGTIGAAMEGAIAGRRAVAISFPFFTGWNNWTQDDINKAVKIAADVTQQLWQEWQAGIDLYNVNVPLGGKSVAGAPVDPAILRTTVDAESSYTSLYAPEADSDGSYVWGPTGLKVFEGAEPVEGGDVAAIRAGNVSVTALKAGFLSQT